MKHRKKLLPKIMAFIALIAIVIGIVGTWALVVINSFWSSNENISQEELQQYIDSLSWSADITVGDEDIVQELSTDISIDNQSE